MSTWIRTGWFLLALLPGISTQALAQEEVRIGKLSYVDTQYMSGQRQLLEDLVARSYGARFTGNKAQDLQLLQRLLDDERVRNDQTLELQAMGVIMGDQLALELGLDWVIYEDRMGRSRALRYKESDSYLFPITMISRRRGVDNRARVADIYQRAVDTITPYIPKLPFQ